MAVLNKVDIPDALCPMPGLAYALCPMPYALCPVWPMPYALCPNSQFLLI